MFFLRDARVGWGGGVGQIIPTTLLTAPRFLDKTWFMKHDFKKKSMNEENTSQYLVTKILSMLAAPLYISFYSLALESGLET